MNHKDTKTQRDPISDRVNGAARTTVSAAFSVHSQLGPGLLESVYEKCLAHAVRLRRLSVDRQIAVPIEFEGLRLPTGLRMDLHAFAC